MAVSFRLIICINLVCVATWAQSPLENTRSTIEKWVETRQLISKTRADWQSDKELLEQSIQLFERELKSLDQSMEKVGTSNSQVEKERTQSETSLKASNDALEGTRAFAADFEKGIAKLAPQLPTPLQDILKPLLNRLPAEGSATKMPATERSQVIVGILNELDKFNNAVSIFSEKRKNQKQEEVAVQTVYVGLGIAYFVNDAGDFAGVGSPGPKGWEWNAKPELATAIQQAIRVYRNELPARFIALPATLK